METPEVTIETPEVTIQKKLMEIFGDKHPIMKYHEINLQDITVLMYRRLTLLNHVNDKFIEESSAITGTDRESKKKKKSIDEVINKVLAEITRLEYMIIPPEDENYISLKMVYVPKPERRVRTVNYPTLCKKVLRLNPEGLTSSEILEKILEDLPELDPVHAKTRVQNTVFRLNRDGIIEEVETARGYKKYVMVQNIR